MVHQIENLTHIHEDSIQSPALLNGLRSGISVNCGVGHRRGLDVALLWQLQL